MLDGFIKAHVQHSQTALGNVCVQDLRYIKSKIHALQHHADEVLDHIYAQAKILDDQHKGDPALIEKQKEIRRNLETHLDNVEAVLKHVSETDEKGHQLTFEEYEVL